MIPLLKPKWHRIPQTPHKTLPHGLYYVASFEGNTLVKYTDYACIEGYWGPNTMGAKVDNPTHYMSAKEFRTLLETAKED